MRIQVLVAAMNQTDYSLPKKMNLQTDAIIGNQCNRNEIEEFEYSGHKCVYLSFAERGVGLNRNNALMRADADICLFADDDMVYKDGYEKIIVDAFRRHPDADVLVFNLEETKAQDGHFVPQRKQIEKEARVTYLNCLRYGTARIAVKLRSIKLNGIAFNLCFGGGTPHCHGEDNLFVVSCLQKGLKMYSIPETIATLTEERESSWNGGFDEHYVQDQGMLFRCMTKKYWKLLCVQDVIRRHGSYNMSIAGAYKTMVAGGKRYYSGDSQ
jgi:glycosyltransferase involved in cell wall biosynthesis